VKVGFARGVLLWVWTLLALPLIFIVTLQTINGKYGAKWDEGFAWLAPLILPTLAVMYATVTVRQTDKDRVEVANRHVFHLALTASAAYLFLLYLVIGIAPTDAEAFQQFANDTMGHTELIFSVIQSLVLVLVGKFFLEDIANDPPTPTRK
jgi:hypothetical protein